MVRKSAAFVGKMRIAVRSLSVLVMVAAWPAWALRFAPADLPLPEGRALIAVLDANGDEAADLAVFPVSGAAPVLLSPSQTGWRTSPLEAGGGEVLAVLAADFNNDMRTDLAVSRRKGATVLFSDGKGGFSAPLRLEGAEAVAANAASLSAGDVNGDGRLDIVESRHDGARGAVRLWSSVPEADKGALAWRSSSPVADTPCCVPAKVLLAELDGDGILDLLVARQGGDLEIHRGGGEARFEKRARDIAGHWTHLDAGDVDNDGDLDLLLGGADGGAALYLNEGGLRFRPATAALPAATAPAVAPRFVDFDSDGRLDIAWSAGVVLLQDDALRFRADPQAAAAPADAGYTIADVNGDGYPDLLYSNPGAAPRLLMQHTGPYHWLFVRLRGDASRAVAGARITAKTPDGRRTVRHLLLGDTVASSHAEGVLLGILRHTQVNTLEIHWLSGRYTRLDEPLVKRPIGFIEPPASDPRQVAFSNPLLEHFLSRKPSQRPQVCRRDFRPPSGDASTKRKKPAPAATPAP